MTDERKVEWIDDYDLLKSFYSKEIKIFNRYNSNEVIYVNLPTVKDYYENESYIAATQIFKTPLNDIQKNFSLWKIDSYFNFFILVCFLMDGVKEFNYSNKCIVEFLKFLFPEKKNKMIFNYNDDNFGLTINNIFVNADLWDYIWYIVWRTFEEKEKSNRPKVFATALEKEFFERQQAAEDKIKAIKAKGRQKEVDDNQLLKTFITIQYAFPQIDFDYLFSCTYAQVGWLYEYSMKVCDYEIEVQALAAGHLKKKFKFFTEK